jgi:hypothetical protein
MEYSNNIQYTIQQTESIKTPVQEKLEDAKRVITQGPDGKFYACSIFFLNLL